MGRFYKSAAISPIDYGFKMPAELMLTAQTKIDANITDAKGMFEKNKDLIKLDTIDADTEQGQALLQSYEESAKAAAEKFMKDPLYFSRGEGLNELETYGNKIKDEFTKGAAFQMQSRSDERNTYVEKLKNLSLSNPDRYNPDYVAKLIAHSDNMQQPLAKDDNTGAFINTNYTPVDPAQKVDASELANTVGAKFKMKGNSGFKPLIGPDGAPTGKYVAYHAQSNASSKSHMAKEIEKEMLANPELEAYHKQYAMLYGLDPDKYHADKVKEAALQSATKNYQYDETKNIIDNPYITTKGDNSGDADYPIVPLSPEVKSRIGVTGVLPPHSNASNGTTVAPSVQAVKQMAAGHINKVKYFFQNYNLPDADYTLNSVSTANDIPVAMAKLEKELGNKVSIGQRNAILNEYSKILAGATLFTAALGDPLNKVYAATTAYPAASDPKNTTTINKSSTVSFQPLVHSIGGAAAKKTTDLIEKTYTITGDSDISSEGYHVKYEFKDATIKVPKRDSNKQLDLYGGKVQYVDLKLNGYYTLKQLDELGYLISPLESGDYKKLVTVNNSTTNLSSVEEQKASATRKVHVEVNGMFPEFVNKDMYDGNGNHIGYSEEQALLATIELNGSSVQVLSYVNDNGGLTNEIKRSFDNAKPFQELISIVDRAASNMNTGDTKNLLGETVQLESSSVGNEMFMVFNVIGKDNQVVNGNNTQIVKYKVSKEIGTAMLGKANASNEMYRFTNAEDMTAYLLENDYIK